MTKVKKLISNSEDNKRCFQACFAMVIEAFTGEQVSMSIADELTGFVDGRPTWAYQGMLNWARGGLYVHYVEILSQEFFSDHPEEAIRTQLKDDEIAQHIIAVSDLKKETELVKLCFNHSNITFEVKQPGLDDVRHYLSRDCLVVANVNYWALLGENKYCGHFVVIESVDESTVTLQNPGLPPIANQVVSKELFLKAWLYPNQELANMIVVSSKPL